MLGNFYKDLEYEHGITCKNTFKRYQNNYNSTIKSITTKNFLIRCRRNKIVPTFITNRTKYLMGQQLRIMMDKETKNLIQTTNRKILNVEIRNTISRISYLKNKAKNIHNKLYRLAPQHLVNNFIHNLKNHNGKSPRSTNKLETKFVNLSRKQTPNIKYNTDWIKNMTDTHLPEEVQMMLALGPKFAVYQNKNEIPVSKIIADVEHIISNTKHVEEHNVIRGKAANIISNHIHTTNNKINRKQLILHNAYLKTKQFLKNNNNIIITAADKGNITIAMDKTEYTNLITKHFDDKTKYRKLTYDPTYKLQTKNNNIIRKLYEQKIISKSSKKQLMTFTAQAPRPKATPKIHKPRLRIIINSTNSPSYNMSRFLNNLNKAIINNNYNIKNSFDLKQKLDIIQLNPDDTMVF